MFTKISVEKFDVFFLVLLVACGGLLAPAQGQEAQGLPSIMCPEPVFNFGERENTGKVEHDFVLRNVGDALLEIQKVRTSCGCTVAQPKEKKLEPGQETVVAVTFNLKGRKGPQTKTITVNSNDPKKSSFQLKLQGTASAAIMLEPSVLNFGRIESDAVQRKSVTLRSTKEEVSFKITKVDCRTFPDLISEVKTVKEGKAYEVSVALPQGTKPGAQNHSIMIHTDNKSYPTISVRLYAQVIGALDYSPDKISIQTIDDPRKVVSQYIRVSAGKVKEFEITGIEAPLDSISHEVRPHPSMSGYMVKIMNLPRDSALDGKFVIIKTSATEMPEIKIPIKTYARAPRYNGAKKAVGRPGLKQLPGKKTPPSPPAPVKTQ